MTNGNSIRLLTGPSLLLASLSGAGGHGLVVALPAELGFPRAAAAASTASSSDDRNAFSRPPVLEGAPSLLTSGVVLTYQATHTRAWPRRSPISAYDASSLSLPRWR